jgi:hypothetical protein
MAVDNEKVKEEASKAVSGMISLITAVLASPYEAVTNYVSGEDKKASYQLIAVQTVAVTLINIIYKLMRNLLTKGTTYGFNSIIQGALGDIATVIVAMAVGAFVITVLAKQEAVDVSFNKALSIASLQAIIMTPVYFVYRFIVCFNIQILTGLAGVVYNASQILAVILTFYGFSVVLKDRKKLFYAIGIYFAVLLLVRYIMGRIF